MEVLRYLTNGPRDFTKNPVPPMERANWEFFAVTKGECAPVYTSGPEKPQTSKLWLGRPDLAYGWTGNGKPAQRTVLQFPRVPRELAEKAASSNRLLEKDLTPEGIRSLKGIVDGVHSHFKNPKANSRLFFERALYEISILLVGEGDPGEEVPLRVLSEERVERAIAWFDSHMSRNPTVAEVASAVHLSEGYLRKLFRDVRGASPHAIFRDRQVRCSIHLLATTSKTTEEIASQCGFRSDSDFSRVFRLVMKYPPNFWRRRLSKGETEADLRTERTGETEG